jgi:hypothetical protein
VNEKLMPLPRCCSAHEDWNQLGEHLCRDFADVPTDQVLADLVEARVVTERFAMTTTEALDAGEVMVRYRLMLRTGQIPDVARTDPQNHRTADSDFSAA